MTCSLLLFAAGWWLVENKDQQIAWFPAPYLEERVTGEESPNARELDEEGESVYPLLWL